AHDNEVGRARLGDHQPLPFAVEKPQSELGLERLDLVTDGALGDKELLGCARKTLVAGRGLEGLERVERGQAARHWPRSWEKLRQGSENAGGLQRNSSRGGRQNEASPPGPV